MSEATDLARTTRADQATRVLVAVRRGPISISSKGHVTIRLGRGFSFRLF